MFVVGFNVALYTVLLFGSESFNLAIKTDTLNYFVEDK